RGVAAHVHRGGDRRDDLVAAENARPAGGAVVAGGDALLAGHARAALAVGVGVAEHRGGVAAHVHRGGDRGDHLVAAETARPACAPVVAGARAAGLRRAPAGAPGDRVTDHAGCVPADVDRGGDRGHHLVAAENARPARRAVVARAGAASVLVGGRAALAPG